MSYLPSKHFPAPLNLRVHPTKPRWAIVDSVFMFHSPSLGLITVEPGFDTDYASVPRLFWSIYPPDGSYRAAAVIHDALYWYQRTGPAEHDKPVTRAQADTVFMEALTALGVPAARRHILHKAVRLGGWVPWGKRARELAGYSADLPKPTKVGPPFKQRGPRR